MSAKKQANGEAMGGTVAEAGEVEAKPKVKRPRVSREEAVRIHGEQKGLCWCLGTPLGPGWTIVDGRAISAEAAKLKGRRSWEELREHILGRIGDEAAEVESVEADLKTAKERQAATLKTLAAVLKTDEKSAVTGVVFHGEKPAEQPAAAPPAEPAPTPAT